MKRNLLTFVGLLALAGILLISNKAVGAAFVQPSVGPTGGNLPTPIDVGSGSQEKVGGKLGLKGANPAGSPYDFILDGSALFTAGVRAGSAFFDGDVMVGDVSPSHVQVYGDMRLFGNGSITNTMLAHTQATPQPVCSTDNGTLTLCSPNLQAQTCIPITQAPTDCLFYDDPGPSSPDNAVCITGVENISGQTVRHYEVQAYNAPNNSGNWITVFTNSFGPSTDTTPTTNLNYSWTATPVEKEDYAPFRIRAFDTQACVGPWSAVFPTQQGTGTL